jgi:outer membrane protein, multidrug efflux system
MNARTRLNATLMLMTLSSCALVPPALVQPKSRTELPIGSLSGTPEGEWPAQQWWHRYDDPQLNQLVEHGLQAAPGMIAASARFAEAQNAIRVVAATAGAQVVVNAGLQRQRISDNGLLPPQFLGFNWYNQADLGVSVNYSFDWWGKQRASIAAAVDAARAIEAEQQATALMLSSTVTDAYFSWIADRQRLQLAQQRLALVDRHARVADLRFAAKLEGEDSVQQATRQAAQVREQIAQLEGSVQMRRVAIAALLGIASDALPQLAERPLPDVATSLPASVRVDLISRRPEIVASRWRVEAARKNAVVARAQFYPDISIRALAGLSSIEIGKLLHAGSAVPAVSAAIHLPLFDAGLREAQFGARQSQLATAVANYDEAILAAVREVAMSVANSMMLAAQRQQREVQYAHSQLLQKSATARLQSGRTDIRPLLEAQQLVIADQDALLQVHAAAVSADISLQRALGGGYLSKEVRP